MAELTSVGIIGGSGMGACHARHAAGLAGVQIAWIADPDEKVGRAIADELGARWVADGHDAIDRCDALVVACPDRFHADFVLAALDRDLPVLCEKPLTVEAADAAAIVEREVKAGRRLVQVGFMRVYDDRHVQVADALASLGEVNHLRCVHRNVNLSARSVPSMLIESIVHDIHSVRWLSRSEIVQVFAATVQRGRGTRFITLTCKLSNGGVAVIEFDDAAAGYEVSVEVSGELGNVVAAEPHRALIRRSREMTSGIGDDWFGPFLGAYRAELVDWIDSVAVGSARGPSAWDGFAAQVVVDAASASDISGRPEAVDLPERPVLYANDWS